MPLRRRLYRVVPFSWSSPFPKGQWLGSTPAGCEVCGEACRNESSALDYGLPSSALDGDTNQVSVLIRRYRRRQYLRLILRLAELPIRRNCRRCAQERATQADWSTLEVLATAPAACDVRRLNPFEPRSGRTCLNEELPSARHGVSRISAGARTAAAAYGCDGVPPDLYSV